MLYPRPGGVLHILGCMDLLSSSRVCWLKGCFLHMIHIQLCCINILLFTKYFTFTHIHIIYTCTKYSMYLPLINGLQKTPSGSRKRFYIIRCSILPQFCLPWPGLPKGPLIMEGSPAWNSTWLCWPWCCCDSAMVFWGGFNRGEVARASDVMLCCRDSVLLW